MGKNKNRYLEVIAETDPIPEKANSAMVQLKKLNPTYHWCPDWDYMVICNEDKEYECCTCIKPVK